MTSQMYQIIISKLKEMGFVHYEISNFAKDSYESKHNLIYWNLDEYLGLGASAASLYKGYRIYNSKLLTNYMFNNDIIKEEILIENQKGEFFWLGLRKINGVSIDRYKELFNSDPFTDFDINALIDKKLLQLDNDILKLTPFGLEHGNYVFSYFI